MVVTSQCEDNKFSKHKISKLVHHLIKRFLLPFFLVGPKRKKWLIHDPECHNSKTHWKTESRETNIYMNSVQILATFDVCILLIINTTAS